MTTQDHRTIAQPHSPLRNCRRMVPSTLPGKMQPDGHCIRKLLPTALEDMEACPYHALISLGHSFLGAKREQEGGRGAVQLWARQWTFGPSSGWGSEAFPLLSLAPASCFSTRISREPMFPETREASGDRGLKGRPGRDNRLCNSLGLSECPHLWRREKRF